MNLERLLASSCRQKILKEMSGVRKINVMELVRKINSTYVEVNRNIKILENEGIVIDSHVGRLRILRLNRENTKTILLLQALKILSLQPNKELFNKKLSFKMDQPTSSLYPIN